MHENVILLNKELLRRKDLRALTPKQEITIEIYNNMRRLERLKMATNYYQNKCKSVQDAYDVMADKVRKQEHKLSHFDI